MQDPRHSDSQQIPNRRSADEEPVAHHASDLVGEDRSMDPEFMTPEDVIDAESARPDLPDETADGLDDMEEEIRHQAEDLPLDTPGRE